MIHPYTLFFGITFLTLVVGPTTTLPAQENRDGELVPLVITLLWDADKDMRALGLEQVRTEAPGKAATEQFAAQLPKLPPAVQVALVRALTDRGDVAARPAIIAIVASSDNEPVRVAALRALGFLGGVSDLRLLFRWLSQGTEVEQAAALASLNRLPGEAVSKAIAAELKRSDSSQRIALLEILVARRAFPRASDLLPLAVDADPVVRAAAMAALSQLAGPEQIAGMVQGVLATERGRQREAAEKALMLVCRRIDDTEQQAKPLLAAMEALNEPDRIAILPTLGRVGGLDALRVVKAALAAEDRKTQQAALRALCNWPNASVAPELISLAKEATHPSDQRTALRALIRVAPLPDGRSDMEKLQLLRSALPLCTRDDERVLVLQRASAIRILETLRFLVPYLDQPTFAQQACQSIVELAHHRSLREPNKAEFDRALEKVKQTSNDATVIDRANRYQKNQTWVRPSRK